VRTIYHMLRPADAPPAVARPVPGLTIRPVAEGEDAALLAALNHAWADTWDFLPITAEMLAQDLEGQRAGMLVGTLGQDPTIIATCHAVWEPADQNPDGSPAAWISNVTTAPAQRGKGVARALLVAGLDFLRARGARSVTLGVDAGNAAPLNLYRSVGFEVFSSVQALERATLSAE
jgi:mycothiol synthase